jgi:hypothetical protein
MVLEVPVEDGVPFALGRQECVVEQNHLDHKPGSRETEGLRSDSSPQGGTPLT